MTANKRALQHTLKSDLEKVHAHVVQPREYEELPELTDDMLSQAVVKRGRALALCESPQADFNTTAR